MAEENITNSPETAAPASGQTAQTPAAAPEKTLEQKYEELMVEFAKLKRASDKTTSEAADWRRKYQATLSEKEQMDMDKAEQAAKREEEFQALLRENRINKLEKDYLGLGYLPEEAAQMAVAEVDGDFETRKKIMSAVDARKRKSYEAEWLKSRPEAFAGAGGEKTSVTKEQFLKMGYAEMVEFKRRFPETYKAYTS